MLPTVYQGQYNAIIRSITDEVLPILRANSIRLYAWSPAAAGFFGARHRVGTDSLIGEMLRHNYNKKSLDDALASIHAAADKHGITGHAIAIRWILHHSQLKGECGDGIVIGARTPEQLEGTLQACEAGPLPKEIVDLVETVHQQTKDDAPYFSPFRPAPPGSRTGETAD